MASSLVIIFLFYSCQADLSSLLCTPSDTNSFYTFQQSIYDANPSILQSTASFPDPNTFLSSYNIDYGYMASARFQMECGQALNVAISSCKTNPSECEYYIDLALNGTLIGFSTQNQTDGSLPVNMPQSIVQQFGQPTLGDVTSATAFFLSAICPSLIMLDEYNTINNGKYKSVLQDLKRKINLTISWLIREINDNALFAADIAAPNRLFHDISAFVACGYFIENEDTMNYAQKYFDQIYDNLYNEEYGVFIEGGGYDTSYQSVNIEMALNVLLLMPSILSMNEYVAELSSSLSETFCEDMWTESIMNATLRLQCSIVDDIPDVNSYNNTRTCGGGESFLGNQKQLSIVTFIYSLLAVGTLNGEHIGDVFVSDAEALYNYYRIKTTMENATSCYECDPLQCLGNKNEWCLGFYDSDDAPRANLTITTIDSCLTLPCDDEATSTTMDDSGCTKTRWILSLIYLTVMFV